MKISWEWKYLKIQNFGTNIQNVGGFQILIDLREVQKICSKCVQAFFNLYSSWRLPKINVKIWVRSCFSLGWFIFSSLCFETSRTSLFLFSVAYYLELQYNVGFMLWERKWSVAVLNQHERGAESSKALWVGTRVKREPLLSGSLQCDFCRYFRAMRGWDGKKRVEWKWKKL